MSSLPCPSQTQVKLVVAACAIHNYTRNEKPDDWIFKKYEHESISQLEESLAPVNVEQPMMQFESQGFRVPFETEVVESSLRLQDSIATEMWNDYVNDFSIR